jgi:GxxExxY protein
MHRVSGPGLLEPVYEAALAHDLREMGLAVKTQVPMPYVYKDIKRDVSYHMGPLVRKQGAIYVKAVEVLASVHFAQTLTYLKLSENKPGLLINFNATLLKGDIHRMVHPLQ